MIKKIVRRVQICVNSFKPLPIVDFDEDDHDAVELLNIHTRILGPNARIVLLELARRLALGAVRHGDLEPRVWSKEIREEILDNLVYMTVDTLAADGALSRKETVCTLTPT